MRQCSWLLLVTVGLLGACTRDKGDAPGKDSDPGSTAAGVASLAFTEFVTETYDDHEWFEVRNTGDEDADLLGLVLNSSEGEPFTVETSFVLGAGAYAVLADSAEIVQIEADVVYGTTVMDRNSGYFDLLWEGTILDTLAWGSGGLGNSDQDQSVGVDNDYASAEGNDYPDVWCDAQSSYAYASDDDESTPLYGTPGQPNDPCPQFDHDQDGMSADEGDCDDTDPEIFPYADETWYDGVDSDCDGDSDYDQDNDGDDADTYGGTDCNDEKRSIHVGASEYCNEVDDDCNGVVDDIDSDEWIRDADEDGKGDAGDGLPVCEQPEGYVRNDNDCDDTEASIYEGADETWYDGVDSDCDGESDYDQDGDGYEAIAYGGEDCDDTSDEVNPDASERCDDLDNDCNGLTDDDDPDVTALDHYFPDRDGDGYGRTLSTGVGFCDPPADYVSDYSDCDDTDATVNPGATEIWYDGVDEDCDGAADEDADGDGWDMGDRFVDDCDDTEPGTYPGAPDYLGIKGVPCFERLVMLDLSGLNSTVTNSGLGESLAGAGDLDGDGVNDAVMGLSGADSTEASGAGYARVVLGRADGAVDLANTAATLNGLTSGDAAGEALAGLGDVDGDGYGDLALGASGLDDGASDAGGAYLILGPVTGDQSLADAQAVVLGVHTRDTAGRQVASLRDGDADGVDEWLIGAPNEDTAASAAGAIYVLGLDSTSTVSLADAEATVLGETTADRAGTTLISAGDTDGDGYDDLLTGSSGAAAGAGAGAGVVWLASGPFSGAVSLSSAEARLEGTNAGDGLGESLVALGDENGDGYDDFAAGATGLTYDGTLADAGGAYLFHGPLTGTSTAEATAFATVLSDIDEASAGSALAWPGDLDDDGVSDLVIGARADSSVGWSDGGAVYLLLGPFSGSRDLSSADDVKYGAQDNEHAGDALAGPGDLTGDGVGELLVGMPGRGGMGAAWLLVQR